MALPPLVFYGTWEEYQEHYLNVYCRRVIRTFDGIRVYFSPDRFGHAFRESSKKDGNKDEFNGDREQRINWIKATLEAPNADLFQGWDNKKKEHNPGRRVSVVYENFVVIVNLSHKTDGTIKGKFVTCYQADNSIGQIRNSPRWTLEVFETATRKKK